MEAHTHPVAGVRLGGHWYVDGGACWVLVCGRSTDEHLLGSVMVHGADIAHNSTAIGDASKGGGPHILGDDKASARELNSASVHTESTFGVALVNEQRVGNRYLGRGKRNERWRY